MVYIAMVKTNEGDTSAMWDKEVTNIFCNLCINEIDAKNRPTTYFSKEGWLNIAKRFKELTGRDYDRLKFKNKWDQLKKEWKIWKELKRGSTELGWDPIKRTIDASDAWWAEKIEAMPTVKKYKQCGIEPEFEEKLDIMFKGVVATGKHAFSPSETGFTGIPDDLPSEPVDVDEEIHSVNQREMGESSSQSKRPRIAKKKKEKENFVNTSFDRLLDAFGAPPPAPVPDSGIVECIRTLATIPEVVADRRFYAMSMKKLEDPTRRQIFIATEPDMRVEYLRVLMDD